MSIYTSDKNIIRKITNVYEKKENIIYKKNMALKNINSITRKIYLHSGEWKNETNFKQ